MASTACKYLIAGSSHAALEAIHAIRMVDADGTLTVVSRDRGLPYSPTVLPYVVSGKLEPEAVALRDARYLEENAVELRNDAALTSLDAAGRRATLANGDICEFEKLLLATGATPIRPPITGLDNVPHHVLRTMDDAVGLRHAMRDAQSAIVLGAGLIGMHAAENLARAGLKVSIVEMYSQVLPGYFDAEAAAMITDAFSEAGVDMRLGQAAEAVNATAAGIELSLPDATVMGDILLVATGVRPVIDYLEGSGIETNEGVLVDDTMATSAASVWAAGDVAQARDFYGPDRRVGGILPGAVEQGRIAGMAMAEDPGLKPYPGGVPLNTYSYFGHKAISVGRTAGEAKGAHPLVIETRREGSSYLAVALDGDRLAGIAAIDRPLDAGVMWQLILRRIELGARLDDFLADPLTSGRRIMSETWR